MSRYTYKLYKGQDEPREKKQNTYHESQLRVMTTFQLREICTQEKLVKNILNPLNKEELVRLIMRYRGIVSNRHIKEYKEDGMKRLNDFLSKTKVLGTEEKDIHIPAKITVYESLGISSLDRYMITSFKDLSEINVLLVDEQNTVCTVFYLKNKENNVYYLMKGEGIPVVDFTKRQYYLMFVNNEISESLYDIYMDQAEQIPYSMKAQKIPLLDIEVREIKESSSPLIIDFGTSNTTAGIFNPQGSFQIIQSEEYSMIPSVIYVSGIKDDKPELLFGAEAVEQQKKAYIDQDLPIFYDIKRFINDAGREEQIVTENGLRLKIARKTLLEQYLRYIIQLSRQQFKCNFKSLQLLAPVRQKNKFDRIFKELLSEYQVECTLDEGMEIGRAHV